MAKRAALAFAAGFGKGAMDQVEREERQKREDEDRAMRRESHDLQRQQAEITLGNARREQEDRDAIARAAAPVTTTLANDVQMDDDGNRMPAAPQFEAGGKRYATQQEADTAAAAANTPQARAERIGLAYMERGQPDKAMQFQEQAQKFADEQWNRQVRDLVPRGHDALAEFMSKTEAGPFKGLQVKAVPSPDGKSRTYSVVQPDGTMKPTQYTFPDTEKGAILAGWALSKVDPETRYRNMVEQDKAKFQMESKERELGLRERTLNEVSIPTAQARAEAATARGEASLARAEAARGKNDSAPSREDRLRYSVLFTDAGRRMQDASKALNTLRGDRAFMRRAATPGSPEAAQLQDLTDQHSMYRDERQMYQRLLAGSQDGDGKGGSKGEKGAAPAPAAGGGPKPSAKPAAKAGSSREAPIEVKSAAERDKLPKGAYYRAPNGEIYVRQ